MNDPNALELPFKIPELIQRVKANRDKHASEYAIAKMEYAKKYKEAIDRRLAHIAAGEDFKHTIDLPVPEQYLKQYDRAIAMLEMTTAPEITLGQELFNQLVLDEWRWSDSFARNTSGYSNSGR